MFEQGKKLHYLYGSASLINAFTFCLCKARWFHIKFLFEKACLSWEWLTQNIDNMETHIDTKCRKVNLNIWTQTWDHNVLWILWWSIHSVWKGIVYSLRCSIVSIYSPSLFRVITDVCILKAKYFWRFIDHCTEKTPSGQKMVITGIDYKISYIIAVHFVHV